MNTSFYEMQLAQSEDKWTIRLSGEVDYAASIELTPRIAEIADRCATDLLFDLEDVTMIDSEGIKALMIAHHRMRSKRGVMRIVRCSRNAERVLKLVGVDQVVSLSAS